MWAPTSADGFLEQLFMKVIMQNTHKYVIKLWTCSPWLRLTNWVYFGMIVTHKLLSPKGRQSIGLVGFLKGADYRALETRVSSGVLSHGPSVGRVTGGRGAGWSEIPDSSQMYLKNLFYRT